MNMHVDYSRFHWDHLVAGTILKIELSGVQCDVVLLTDAEAQAFNPFQRFWYTGGGHYTHSPAVIQVPSSGSWHLYVVPTVIGQVHGDVTVVPPALFAGV